MRKVAKVIGIILVFLLILAHFTVLIKNGNLQLLNPQGTIAKGQSQILWSALILAMIIGIPVVAITFFTALTYKDGNHKRKYTPEWTSGKLLTFVWWAIPIAFICVLAAITWITTHQLDPYKPIPSKTSPITIQVVALSWKWLFIYPKEKIATVNFIEFPVNTPLNFQLTADAPMNSFWIPSLGGQIYAMSGMVTQLHLLAGTTGEFPGSAAEINGDGFSGMNFTAKSVSATDYKNWVEKVKSSGKTLDLTSYNELSKPSSNNPPAFYMYADKNLYNEIIMKYMVPQNQKMDGSDGSMQGMDMHGM